MCVCVCACGVCRGVDPPPTTKVSGGGGGGGEKNFLGGGVEILFEGDRDDNIEDIGITTYDR